MDQKGFLRIKKVDLIRTPWRISCMKHVECTTHFIYRQRPESFSSLNNEWLATLMIKKDLSGTMHDVLQQQFRIHSHRTVHFKWYCEVQTARVLSDSGFSVQGIPAHLPYWLARSLVNTCMMYTGSVSITLETGPYLCAFFFPPHPIFS